MVPSALTDAILEHFDRLDRAFGSHNHVTLMALRLAMHRVNRAAFDAALQKLRFAGILTLQGAEGRHGIDPAEREAGIEEHGRLLLYVSRRD